MNLLLFETETRTSPVEEKTTVPPLGLAYIAAVCKDAGYRVELIDLNISRGGLGEKIKKADVVGVSCYTPNYPEALQLLRRIKGYGKKVVLGGPHATFCYREALKDGFDFVVRGEGEPVMLELLRRLERGEDVKGIKGLAYEDNRGVSVRGAGRVKDLNTLPFPTRHLLELEKYTYPGAIATSRGCAYTCIFCSSRGMSGPLRLRKAKSVVAEVEHIKSLSIDSFFVIDPNFAYDSARVADICEGIKDLEMEWYAELRLDHINEGIIQEMAKAGCKVVRFGIESGSQRIVDLIRKGIRVKDVLKIVKTSAENGIVPVCGFMIGHPAETKQEVEDTIKLAMKIRELGGEAAFSVLTPYPGTYLFRNAKKLGIKLLTTDWQEYHHLNPVIETENFSREELRNVLFKALSIDSTSKDLPKRKSFRALAYKSQKIYYG
jgi:radical SAM superfamily enzyme YgiQ (UPF0313 family)